jgi:enoyl-CoA hydratase/carnithine racemase
MFDYTLHGDVAVLRLAHGKASALDLELCSALTAQLEEYRRSSAKALVLTGTGRIFSAGVDLVRITTEGAPYMRAFLPALNRALETLFSLLKPVVAAVNGHAIAGGCIMACAADHRLMARDGGRIGIPELLVGVPFPVVPLEIMRFAVAPPHLQLMISRGLTLAPDEALQRGVVDAVVDPDRVVHDAIGVAQALAAIPVSAFALTKRLLREPVLERIHVGAALDAIVQDAWASAEILDAVRGYVERTLGKK